jgi:hypothetical protein
MTGMVRGVSCGQVLIVIGRGSKYVDSVSSAAAATLGAQDA